MMITSVQTRIHFFNPADKNSLRKLILRDMRVMNRVLGILQFNEQSLFSQLKSGKWNVSRRNTDDLMVSTRARSVPHNLKSEFVNISHNELRECIDNACEMYKSYLRKRTKRENVSHPVMNKRTTRRIGYDRFRLSVQEQKLSVMDSRQTNYEMIQTGRKTTRHKYLSLRLVMGQRIVTHLDQGKVKSVVISKKEGKYYVNLSIEVHVDKKAETPKPLAVLGLDLGISKTITGVVYTRNGIETSKIFNDLHAKKNYEHVDRQVAKYMLLLQLRSIRRYTSTMKLYRKKSKDWIIRMGVSEVLDGIYAGKDPYIASHRLKFMLASYPDLNKYETRLLKRISEFIDHGQLNTKSILRRLHKIRNRRSQIKKNMINKLCFQVQQLVKDLEKIYSVHISLGDISGIRNRARRGKGTKGLRRKVNFWAYQMVSQQLKHDFTKIGMDHRFIEVKEAWTSIMCYRCNTKGSRKAQSMFKCLNPTCLLRINADINGAANIAKRGILYKKLVPYKEMDQWHIPKKAIKRRKSKYM